MITYQQALTAREFWHAELVNPNLKLKDAGPGAKPTKCRRNGKTQTWKKWPGLFRIPVKYGLKSCFYIQNFDDGGPNTPAAAGKGGQRRNDTAWCTPELWDAEHVLFEGVTHDGRVKPT